MLTVFMKHAKNFISKDQSRPLFQTIMFTGTHAMATNTYICAVIPFNSDKQNIDYKTGEIIPGEPPSWRKVIPKKFVGSMTVSHDDVPVWVNVFKTALKVSGKSDYNIFSFKDNIITAKYPDRAFTCTLPIKSKQGSIDQSFSIGYFLNTLEFIKDLQVNEFTINFAGGLTTAVIKFGDAIVAISPVRVGN